ncbi:MAG: hypothetical protein PHQ20_00535 [Candidatus Moranbacteria bacterium]|jgi:hypothetical protein|nr:hypothetical protein [Candidatus Moranbacteria bacterium]
MKNDLETLFGCRSRWRIIKFFILNDNLAMTANEIKTRNKLSASESSTVIGQLVKARFLFSRLKNKQKIYYLNSRYPFYQELKNLVVKSNIYPQCSSLKRVEKLGEVKLALISGAFVNYPRAKTDFLIVGDLISKAKFNHLLEELEAELGREINYSLLSFQEFKYRVNMFDKFILEIFEEPHEIIINKVPNLTKEIVTIKKSKF